MVRVHLGTRAAQGGDVCTSGTGQPLQGAASPDTGTCATALTTLQWAPAGPPLWTLRLSDFPGAKTRLTLSLEAHSKSPLLQVGPGSSHVLYRNEIPAGKQTHSRATLDPQQNCLRTDVWRAGFCDQRGSEGKPYALFTGSNPSFLMAHDCEISRRGERLIVLISLLGGHIQYQVTGQTAHRGGSPLLT